MATSKNSTLPGEKQEELHICSICEKLVAGEHVYIRTRRRTELFIHPECMRRGARA